MSDQHHGTHGGGHEIDAPPTRELFNIIWGLSAVTLLSLVTCVQLFNNQARDLNAERGKEGSWVLQEYRKDQETRTRGSGQDQLTDATGKVVASYGYIPLASARELILSKPEKLSAFAPPPGWVHPDDIASGGQGAGTPPSMPTPPPAPADGTAVIVGPDGQPVPGGTPTPAGPTPGDGSAAPAVPPGTPPPAGQQPPQPTTSDASAKGQAAGQSPSSPPVPGGTPEPVGRKTPATQPAAQPVAPAAPATDGK